MVLWDVIGLTFDSQIVGKMRSSYVEFLNQMKL